jgi:hypothetical protein
MPGFKLLLLTIISSAILLTLMAADRPAANHAPTSWPESRASQLLFFAVLEGLYRDGVSNDDVDLIIPPTQSGKPRFDPEHFVYACPLCHPAFEAFSLYRKREAFYGLRRLWISSGQVSNRQQRRVCEVRMLWNDAEL